MNLSTGITIAALVCAAAAGYSVRGMQADRDRAEYMAQAEAELNQARQTAEAQAQAQREAAANAADRYQDEKNRLNQRYAELLAEFDRMRSDRAGSAANPSGAPKAPQRAGAASAGKSPGTHCIGPEQRRELLSIARDCDVIAAGRNALLEIYQAAQKGQTPER